MAIIDSLGLAVHVREFRQTSSGSNWSLIANSGGQDVLHLRMMVSPPVGTTASSPSTDPASATARAPVTTSATCANRPASSTSPWNAST